MRICVLSDSHAAALKDGYDALPAAVRQDLTVTFFASRQNGLSHLRPRNGKLVAGKESVTEDIKFTSGGHTSVDPSRYDAFIIHALGLQFQYVPFDDIFRSSAFVLRVVDAAAERCISLRLQTRLRPLTKAPIFMSPRPYISEGDSALRARMQRTPTARYGMQEVLCERAAKPGTNTHWLQQPQDTIVDGCFTAQSFSVGSRRLDVNDPISGKAHPADDFSHMNAAYGLRYWENFIADTRLKLVPAP